MHLTSTLSHSPARAVTGACPNPTRAQAPNLKLTEFRTVGPTLRAQRDLILPVKEAVKTPKQGVPARTQTIGLFNLLQA